MRWLPKGTHEWSKFITPDELFELIRVAGLEPVDRKGFVFNPVSWQWRRLSDRDLSVNYASLHPLSLITDQHISLTPYSLQVSRLFGITFNLAPQPRDLNINGSILLCLSVERLHNICAM